LGKKLLRSTALTGLTFQLKLIKQVKYIFLQLCFFFSTSRCKWKWWFCLMCLLVKWKNGIELCLCSLLKGFMVDLDLNLKCWKNLKVKPISKSNFQEKGNDLWVWTGWCETDDFWSIHSEAYILSIVVQIIVSTMKVGNK